MAGVVLATVMAWLLPAFHAETVRPWPAPRGAPTAWVAVASPSVTATPDAGSLKGALAARFRAMDAAGQGIFNEDVTSLVAPRFPEGLSFDDATAAARRQGLGPLAPFKGHGEPGMAATFVTELDLADSGLSNVFVAVYLAFAKEQGGLVLRHTTAYLRAADM